MPHMLVLNGRPKDVKIYIQAEGTSKTTDETVTEERTTANRQIQNHRTF